MGPRLWKSAAAGAVAALIGFGCATAPREPVRFASAECAAPPALHCPDADCSAETVIDGGPAVEPATGRSYFLDYPCDLAPGEDVTLVLSLHGAGSYGNWQRHYFPLLDHVDEDRLVVLTPNAPTQFWTASDDAYLQAIVASAIDELGRDNIRSFWLVGHSQGGMTSNRLVCTDFFRDKVDGWLSLSGGRIGRTELSPSFGLPGGAARTSASGDAPARPPGAPPAGANGPGPGGPALNATPTCDINFIYETGQLEIAGLPETSPWADKYGCAARVREEDVVDVEPGYVYDSTRQDPPNPAWGRQPRPGRAEVFVYPNCRGGRVVADVMRLDKGHTEGLEPRVTETLIDLMLSAPGGKLKSGSG